MNEEITHTQQQLLQVELQTLEWVSLRQPRFMIRALSLDPGTIRSACCGETLDHPEYQRLLEVMCSEDFNQRLEKLGGYQINNPGDILL